MTREQAIEHWRTALRATLLADDDEMPQSESGLTAVLSAVMHAAAIEYAARLSMKEEAV